MYKVQFKDQTCLKGYKEKKVFFYGSALKKAKKLNGIVFDKNNFLIENFIKDDDIVFYPEKNTGCENLNLNLKLLNGRFDLIGEHFKTQNEYKALRTLMYCLSEMLSTNKDFLLIDSFIGVGFYGYSPHFIVETFDWNKEPINLRIFNDLLDIYNIKFPKFIPNYIDIRNECYNWYKEEAVDLYSRCFRDNTLHCYGSYFYKKRVAISCNPFKKM
ncbi:MAG: hypothetical protein LBF97_02480 [Elusimicrobiota bacterium]|jgi:hypothetical protein|nr:hypothetical protein [Elusimicrobiota bacterium]